MNDTTYNPAAAMPKTIDTPRGKIEYAEYGEGPAVICAHGAMGGYDQSLLLARTIGAGGFRYIGISRPGYLGTPISSGKSPEEQADLVAALMDTLGIDTAIMMVVSGGGPCGLTFALRHADRCRGLVLVSTCGGIVNNSIPFSFKLMTYMLRFPALAKGIEKKASENTEMAAARSIPDPDLRARTMNDPEVGPLFRELLASTSIRMPERIIGTENDIRVTRATDYPLEQISVPTLIIHGTKDSVVNFEGNGQKLADRIPNAKLIKIENGEHVAIFTHHAQILPEVAEFLRGCST